MDILPTGKRMVTRTPLHLYLVQTQNKKEAFSAIKQLFARGQKEVYMYGGKIGSWR